MNDADNVEKIVEDKDFELDNKNLSEVAGGSMKYRPEDPDALAQKDPANLAGKDPFNLAQNDPAGLAKKDPHNIL